MASDFERFSKRSRFESLITTAKYCDLCPRMEERGVILSEKNGDIFSKVLFIAEAPGRLGADRTKTPLLGDKAGDNFEILLSNIGWERSSVFITNAVLCNPRDENGNNDTPTQEEILNCSAYLMMTISLVDPEVIVTLGSTALKALSAIRKHSYTLKENVREVKPWFGRKVFIAYHPGQRAIAHRSLTSQIGDYYELSKSVDPRNGLKSRPKKKKQLKLIETERANVLTDVIAFLIRELERCSKFKLTKLLYLADLKAIKEIGSSITGSIYLRQVDGPWPPKIDEALEYLEGYEVNNRFVSKKPYIYEGPSPRFEPFFTEAETTLLLEIVKRYRDYNNSRIKTAVYSTRPMRNILAREKAGENLLNKPVRLISNS